MKSLSTPIFIEAAVLLSLSLAGPMSAWADAPQHHDRVPGLPTSGFRDSADESKAALPMFGEAFPQ